MSDEVRDVMGEDAIAVEGSEYERLRKQVRVAIALAVAGLVLGPLAGAGVAALTSKPGPVGEQGIQGVAPGPSNSRILKPESLRTRPGGSDLLTIEVVEVGHEQQPPLASELVLVPGP